MSEYHGDYQRCPGCEERLTLTELCAYCQIADEISLSGLVRAIERRIKLDVITLEQLSDVIQGAELSE